MHNLLTQINQQREQLTRHLVAEKAKQETLLTQKEGLVKEQAKLSEKQEACLLKKEILEQASTAAREEGKALFEKVVTNSLQMVFNESSSAFVVLGRKSNTPTAEVMVRAVRDGKVVETDPCEEDGGGVADIVSTGIFMTTSLLGGQDNVAPFFLDEPTKYVSAEHAESSAFFLKSMTEYTERQTFLTTHEREHLPFAADRTFLITMDEQGVSHADRFAEAGVLVQE